MFWFRYPDKFVSTGMATIAYGIPALKYETATRSLSTNWWKRPNATSVIVAVTEGWLQSDLLKLYRGKALA